MWVLNVIWVLIMLWEDYVAIVGKSTYCKHFKVIHGLKRLSKLEREGLP